MQHPGSAVCGSKRGESGAFRGSYRRILSSLDPVEYRIYHFSYFDPHFRGILSWKLPTSNGLNSWKCRSAGRNARNSHSRPSKIEERLTSIPEQICQRVTAEGARNPSSTRRIPCREIPLRLESSFFDSFFSRRVFFSLVARAFWKSAICFSVFIDQNLRGLVTVESWNSCFH